MAELAPEAMVHVTSLVEASLKWIAGQGVRKEEPFFTRPVLARVGDGTGIIAVVYSQHAPLSHPAFLPVSRLNNTDVWPALKEHVERPIDVTTTFRLVGVQPLPNDGGPAHFIVHAIDCDLQSLPETSKRFDLSNARLDIMKREPQVLEAFHRGVCVGCGIDSLEEQSVKVCGGCKMLRFCKDCKVERKIHKKRMCRELARLT
jgi:hypothetical protein